MRPTVLDLDELLSPPRIIPVLVIEDAEGAVPLAQALIAARLMDLPVRDATKRAHAVAARVITQRGAIVPTSDRLATE